MWRRLSPGSFYGETLRTYRTGELLLAESSYPQWCKIPTHTHDRPFCYLISRAPVSKPAAPWRGPVFHQTWCSTRRGGPLERLGWDWWTLSAYRIRPDLAAECPRTFASSGSTAEFGSGPPVWLATRLYKELQAPDSVSPLVIDGLALELVAHAARDAIGKGISHPPLWLRRVEDILRSRFQDPPTLVELARVAGVHSVHLATTFRRHLRCTPGEYVRRRRIEFACRQLVRATPLVEIALDAGFAHQSHFCRVFKMVTGMTLNMPTGNYSRPGLSPGQIASVRCKT